MYVRAVLVATPIFLFLITLSHHADRASTPLGRHPLAGPAREATPLGAPFVAPRVPLFFEENLGQAPGSIRFIARAPGLAVGIEPVRAVFAVSDAPSPRGTGNAVGTPSEPQTSVCFLEFVGAEPGPPVSSEGALPGRISYYRGRDTTAWVRQAPTCTRVRCRGLYPGIDLVYHTGAGRLEYDFEVAPGADPASIEMRLAGADHAAITPQGQLRIVAGRSEFVHEAPVAWQVGKKGRRFLSVRFVQRAVDTFGFGVRDYDPSEPLVIDPVLSWSTHLGGSLRDSAQDVAVDATGAGFVTGYTRSADFPTSSGTLGGGQDAFVAKLDPTGASVLWCTYLGGSSEDNGLGLALDGSGGVFVTGISASADFPVFPVPGAYQETFGGGIDAFVTRLDGAGQVLYSSYLGGPGTDSGFDVGVGPGGHVYLTGGAQAGFPTTPGAFDTSANGGVDAYVAGLDPAGGGVADLLYSTFLGGSYADIARGIAVDGSGNVCITGETTSVRGAVSYPTTPNAYKRTQKVPANTALPSAFITKLNPAGAGSADLVYSTFLNNPGGLERGNAIAVDSLGRIYATGYTSLSTHPTTTGAYDRTHNGSADAWLTVLDASQSGTSSLVYSTFLGGGAEDYGQGIAVDSAFQVTLVGATNAGATPFPTTADAFPFSPSGFDVFVTRLSIAGNGAADLVYSTILGGEVWDDGQDVALRGTGEITVCGGTSSASFPVTGGAFDPSPNGNDDGFVLRIDLAGGLPSAPANLTALTVSDAQIDLAWQDTASNETGFEVERSTDGSAWGLLVTLGIDVSSLSDIGLSPGTTWYYRVRAINTHGTSAWSNTASATTVAAGTLDIVASGEMSVSGTVTNTFTSTHATDGQVQSIQEIETGGNPSNRYSYLEYRWTFASVPAGVLGLHAVAYQTASSDDDTFLWSWSSDGLNFTDLYPVLSNVTPQSLSWSLTASHPGGTITIKVVDTDRVPGHRAKDTLTIDHLFIRKS